MPETRRDLFRTSVLSALGGLAAGALAGCNTIRYAPVVDMPAGSVAAVRGTNNDGTVHLYFFSFAGDNSSCSVYSLPAAPSPPITNVFDTATLFSAIRPALKQITTFTPTTFVLNDGVTTHTLNMDFYVDSTLNYVLTTPALSDLLSVAKIYSSQAAGSWNEIGKQ